MLNPDKCWWCHDAEPVTELVLPPRFKGEAVRVFHICEDCRDDIARRAARAKARCQVMDKP